MIGGTRFRGASRSSRIAAGLFGFWVLAWRPPVALACSLASPPEHVIDPKAQASDSTAPGAPAVTVAKIERGKGQAACSYNTCEGIGTVVLDVSASDDQTPSEGLGYRVELVSGQAPTGLHLPAGAVQARDGQLRLHWSDGDTDEQEAISFSLAVTAVDLAGNVGPASTADVQDAGSTGCNLGRHRPGSSWHLTTFVILLLARLVARPNRSP
jgi:hypothetical protein